MNALKKLGIDFGTVVTIVTTLLFGVGAWYNLKADVRSEQERNTVQDQVIQEIKSTLDDQAKSSQTTNQLLYKLDGKLDEIQRQMHR